MTSSYCDRMPPTAERRPGPVRRLLIVMFALVTACVAADGAAAIPDLTSRVRDASCGGTQPIALRNLPSLERCDLTGRVIFHGDIGVTVPPAGLGAGASGASARGGEISLRVENRGGAVWVSTAAPGAGRVSPSREPAGGVPAKCSDRTYHLSYGGHPWAGTVAWSYKASSTPAEWSSPDAVNAIAAAGRTMARGANSCKLRGRIDASIDYLGTTAASPSITSNPTRTDCGSANATNVVAWGELAGDYLGFTCYWWNSQNMVGADLLFEDSPQVVQGVPRDCVEQLDLRALATHEWGHAFGLDHIGQHHSNLVMSRLVATCSLSDRTLGLGDYNGLKHLYGIR